MSNTLKILFGAEPNAARSEARSLRQDHADLVAEARALGIEFSKDNPTRTLQARPCR
jgi:hypothetical protein